MSWQDEKKWSDRFLPEIKRNLGEFLLTEPPIEEDQLRCTDLTVLKMNAVRIACRVRRFTHLQKYGEEFTIRSRLKSGGDTEISKIISGWGDYIFYGFSNQAETKLEKWFVGDLNVFRLWFNRCLYTNQKPWVETQNVDGDTSFMAFRVQAVTGSFVVDFFQSTPHNAYPEGGAQ